MIRRTTRGICIAIIILVNVEVFFLIFRISPARLFVTFLWPIHRTPLHPFSLAGVLFAAAFLLVWTLTKGVITWKRLLLLMVAFVAIQMSLALMEGNGLMGLERRLLTTGHGSLAKATLSVEDPWKLLTHYEESVEHKALGSYGVTKAPGYFLPYWLFGRIARWISPGDASIDQLHEGQAAVAALICPLLSALFLLPLWLAARKILSPESVRIVLLLALFIPNLQLMTLHVDQFLLPTLTAFILLALINLMENPGPLSAFLTSLAFSIGLFFSLSLIVLFIYPILLLAFRPRQRFAPLGLFFLFLSLLGAGGSLILHLDPLLRFCNAVRFHHHWSALKLADLGGHGIVAVGISNLGEFLLWVGPAVAVLALIALVRWRAKWMEWSLATLIIFLQMAFLSGTVGESARLWLFMLPPLLILSGKNVIENHIEEPRRFLLLLLIPQALILIGIKLFMDFL